LTMYAWRMVPLYCQKTVSVHCPGRLSLELFLSGRIGVTRVKRLAFEFRVVVMHSTPVTCVSSVR
jgi:hypothetical protein